MSSFKVLAGLFSLEGLRKTTRTSAIILAEIRVEYLITYARSITGEANLLISMQNGIISDRYFAVLYKSRTASGV
jgi:hypothetical protein